MLGGANDVARVNDGTGGTGRSACLCVPGVGGQVWACAPRTGGLLWGAEGRLQKLI